MFHIVNEHTTNNSLVAYNGNFYQCQPGPQMIYTALEGFKREVEITEIKHGELTSGEFSEPQSKRTTLKDEKYDEIILIMSTFCNENVMSYMDKLVEVYCK